MTERRRFPPPWPIEEHTESFIVKDANGQQLAYLYFEDEPQHYVVVRRKKEHPPVWEWRIQRRSKPMGVQLRGTGFRSETTARLAGETALREFFNGLSRERNRSGSQ